MLGYAAPPRPNTLELVGLTPHFSVGSSSTPSVAESAMNTRRMRVDEVDV